jgi:hypothetical protein
MSAELRYDKISYDKLSWLKSETPKKVCFKILDVSSEFFCQELDSGRRVFLLHAIDLMTKNFGKFQLLKHRRGNEPFDKEARDV